MIRRLLRFMSFLLFYVWEVVASNIRVAVLILMPVDRLKTGIVRVPIEPCSDRELTLLANLITMTPGSLSVDVSSDRTALYVHVMDNRDPEEIRESIRSGLQKRIGELFPCP